MATKRNSAEAAKHRRELFVRAYMTNGQDAGKAWVSAGGSQNGAKQSGYRVLQEPEVQAMLKAQLTRQLEEADITASRVMLELGRRAFADVRDCFDADGKLLPIAKLTDDAAASIDGIEVEVDKDGRPTTIKIKRAGKDPSLAVLARHFKIVGSDLDETVGKALAFAERLGRARERARQLRK